MHVCDGGRRVGPIAKGVVFVGLVEEWGGFGARTF
jgi:hypothetical protein